jgi:hypothetical protein
MAVGAVKAVGDAAGWMQGKNVQDRNGQARDLEELAKRKEAVKQKMFDDIAVELGRMGSGNGGELREGFESLRDSLPGRLDSDSAMTTAVDELNTLRVKLRTCELDEAQCRSRTEAVRGLLEALRVRDVPPYRGELARLEGELGKISTLPVEARMLELQGMLEELREMETLAEAAAEADIGALEERRYVFEPHVSEDPRRIILEIRDWADRVGQMDDIEGEKLRPLLENLNPDTPFPDRLIRLRDQMKTTWGALRERAASTVFFREKLLELLELLQASQDAAESGAVTPLGGREGSELIRRCGTLCAGKFIDRRLFMTLYEDISRFVWAWGEEIADAFFAQKVEQTLAELGYELLTDDLPEADFAEIAPALQEPALREPALRPGQVRYLESPYEGYRVMAKVDPKGVVTTRLVRAVDSEEEKNASAAEQRQKDVEAGKKWCRDLDGFLDKMKARGMPIDVTLRKEPEESELLTVVDKNMRGRKKKRGKGRGNLQERTLYGEGEAR